MVECWDNVVAQIGSEPKEFSRGTAGITERPPIGIYPSKDLIGRFGSCHGLSCFRRAKSSTCSEDTKHLGKNRDLNSEVLTAARPPHRSFSVLGLRTPATRHT